MPYSQKQHNLFAACEHNPGSDGGEVPAEGSRPQAGGGGGEGKAVEPSPQAGDVRGVGDEAAKQVAQRWFEFYNKKARISAAKSPPTEAANSAGLKAASIAESRRSLLESRVQV